MREKNLKLIYDLLLRVRYRHVSGYFQVSCHKRIEHVRVR